MSETLKSENQTPASKPKKKHWYVRWWAIVLYVIIGLIVISCLIPGGDDKSETKKDNSNKTESAEVNKNINQVVVNKLGEDVKVEDVRWKLLEAENIGNTLKGSVSNYPMFTDDKTTSGKYIRIKMEVENQGSEMKTITSLKLKDSKNREFTGATDVSDWIPKGEELFVLDNLNPNVPIQFTELYEVPVDADGLVVIVGDLSFWGSKSAQISLGL